MSFLETVQRARSHLERQGRVSLLALRREFELDDEGLDALISELVDVQQVAARAGKLLTWVGPAVAPTAQADAPAPAPAVTPGPADAEHRQITVMFCDLLDSTEQAAQLGPEAWFEVLRIYQETAAGVVEDFGGHVAQYLGDGILAYFGYPKAHENDVERAVRAGLRIPEAIALRSAEIEERHRVRLAVRLGIHTGPVVLGEMGEGDKREMLALGSTMSIAARVQAIAEPSSVLVTDETLRLARGVFVTEDMGPHALKGIDAPVTLHRVLRPSGIRSRIDFAGARLTRFVGRDQELGLLRDRWALAQEGEGQAVLVVGEAGLGKSRLAGAFRAALSDSPHIWLDAHCSTFKHGASFAPLLELLERGLGFEDLGSPEEKLAALEAMQLPRLPPDMFVPYLAELLSLPPSPNHPLPSISPEKQRERSFEVLTSILLALSESQPVVLFIEDLHWADPSTLEVVARMVDQVPTARVLLLVTARPQYWPDWARARTHVSIVSVAALAQAQARELVAGVLDGRSLPESVLEQLIARADGVPLFLEELTKSVLGSGLVVAHGDHYELADSGARVEVPRTVQDSLTARLDQLSSAKQTAQLAATLGRSFHYELIAATDELDDAVLRAGLERLVEAEILFERGVPPHSTYVFKHALIQDTAYESQLASVRRARHARVAVALEEHFPGRVAAEPEVLAHHHAHGGRPEAAARFYEAAGQRAAVRLASQEAVGFFRSGLEQLALLEESKERHQLEISLRVGLGGPLSWLQGHFAPEVVETYDRLRVLADLVGEGPQQLPAWLGLVTYYTQTASMRSMRDLGYAILRSAEPLGVTPLTAVGHLLVGNSQNPLGPMSVAAEHLERVLALDAQGHVPPPTSFSEIDMIVVAKASLGISRMHLGRPASGIALQREAVARAREIDHVNSLVIAQILSAVLAYQSWAPELARETVAEGIRVAGQHEFRSQVHHLEIYQGWLRVVDGDEAGADQAIEAFEAYVASGGTTLVGWLSCVIAGVLQQAGRGEAALRHLDRVDELVDRAGEDNYRPSAYHTRGRIHLEAGREAEAEAWLLRALETARASESCNDQLAIGLTLAPLWIRAGRAAEARVLLGSTHARFADGFELPLLRRAQAAIADLDRSLHG